MAHTGKRFRTTSSSRRISEGGLDFIVIIVVPIYFTWIGILTLPGDELLCLGHMHRRGCCWELTSFVCRFLGSYALQFIIIAPDQRPQRDDDDNAWGDTTFSVNSYNGGEYRESVLMTTTTR